MQPKRQTVYEEDEEDEDIVEPNQKPRKDAPPTPHEKKGEDIRLPPPDSHVRQDVDW